jgi:hypothetical protein
MINIGLINWYYSRPWWANILINLLLPISWGRGFDVNILAILFWILVANLIK